MGTSVIDGPMSTLQPLYSWGVIIYGYECTLEIRIISYSFINDSVITYSQLDRKFIVYFTKNNITSGCTPIFKGPQDQIGKNEAEKYQKN